jgi:ribose transport system ATP-binding protein
MRGDFGRRGLVGSGRTETLRAIFGADPKTAGEVIVGDQKEGAQIAGPGDAMALGIGMVPEDRKQDGLLLGESIRVNTTLATMPRHSSRPGLDKQGR